MKKRKITLIEVIIGLTILSIFSTIIGVNVKKSLSTYKLNCIYNQIQTNLIFAKRMSIFSKTDIFFKIYKKNNFYFLCVAKNSDNMEFINKKLDSFYLKVNGNYTENLEILVINGKEVYPNIEMDISLDSTFLNKKKIIINENYFK